MAPSRTTTRPSASSPTSPKLSRTAIAYSEPSPSGQKPEPMAILACHKCNVLAWVEAPGFSPGQFPAGWPTFASVGKCGADVAHGLRLHPGPEGRHILAQRFNAGNADQNPSSPGAGSPRRDGTYPRGLQPERSALSHANVTHVLSSLSPASLSSSRKRTRG